MHGVLILKYWDVQSRTYAKVDARGSDEWPCAHHAYHYSYGVQEVFLNFIASRYSKDPLYRAGYVTARYLTSRRNESGYLYK